MKIKTPLIIICLSLLLVSIAAGQSGGNYTITQSVIAGGGGQNSTGGTFSLDGTIGQAVAGGGVQQYPYRLQSGFWTASLLNPTAASVTVGGRVLNSAGRGIRNVLIVMTDSTGAMRTALSTSFGYYSFADVPAGETYILSARAKRFAFAQPTQVVSVSEETTEINFIAYDAPRDF